MNRFLYDQAITQIESAHLSAPIYRTARRLLDRASAETGYLEISHYDALTLVESEAWGTVRNHLISLERAGIIKKWLNHSVRIWFCCYPAPAWMAQQPMAEVATEDADCTPSARDRALGVQEGDPADDDRALGVQNRALGVQNRALGVQNRALGVQNYTHAHAGSVGWLVGNFQSDLDLDPNQPTPLPPTEGYVPTATEQNMNQALLRRIGVLPANTKKWAASMPFGRVRDAAAHWFTNRKSQGGQFDEEPKILNYWFAHWDDCLIPTLEACMVTETGLLWPLRELLFTPPELQAEADRIAQERQAEERWLQSLTETTSPVKPAAIGEIRNADGQVDPGATWAAVLRELKTQIPVATYQAYIEPTWAISYTGGVFTIGLTNARAYDWLDNRLKPKLRRMMTGLLGEAVTVEIQA